MTRGDDKDHNDSFMRIPEPEFDTAWAWITGIGPFMIPGDDELRLLQSTLTKRQKRSLAFLIALLSNNAFELISGIGTPTSAKTLLGMHYGIPSMLRDAE